MFKFVHLKKYITQERMNNLIVCALIAILQFPSPSQSDTNHLCSGGVFGLDIGTSEIPLTQTRKRTKTFKESVE